MVLGKKSKLLRSASSLSPSSKVASDAGQSIATLDEESLHKLNRVKIQQLARRENIKANIKTDAIIVKLLEKYPEGIPRLPSSGQKRNKKQSVVRPEAIVKEENEAPDHGISLFLTTVEPNLFSASQSRKSRGATPEVDTRLPPHLPCDYPPQLVLTTSSTPSVADNNTVSAGNSTRVSPTPHATQNNSTPRTPKSIHRPLHAPHSPSQSQPTYHETHQMLRILTKIINATSLDPQSSTSIEYKINEIDQLLDEKVIPRLMMVDKDVKDIVWMRLALENEFLARLKEDGVLPAGYMNKKVYNVGGADLPAPGNKQQTANASGEGHSSNKRKRDPSASDDNRSLSPLEYPTCEEEAVPSTSKRSRIE